MQLHELKPKSSLSSKKRVGRGGKRGTYSGKGVKGQKSRAGRKFQPAIRVMIKKYHKLRGYNFNPIKDKPEIVNLSDLEDNFNSGDIVTPTILLEKGLVKRIKGKIPSVKILGKGNLTKTIEIKECEASKSAEAKIKQLKKK